MRISERQTLRREYVKKKAGAYSFSGCLVLPLAFLLLFTLLSVNAIRLAILAGWDVSGKYGGILSVPVFSIFAALGAWGSWCCCKSMVQSFQEGKSTRYIPPVTPNTLPADEVLVRASQEPEQEQSAVLLRAAETNETPAEELLRAAKSIAQTEENIRKKKSSFKTGQRS